LADESLSQSQEASAQSGNLSIHGFSIFTFSHKGRGGCTAAENGK